MICILFLSGYSFYTKNLDGRILGVILGMDLSMIESYIIYIYANPNFKTYYLPKNDSSFL